MTALPALAQKEPPGRFVSDREVSDIKMVGEVISVVETGERNVVSQWLKLVAEFREKIRRIVHP